MESIEQRKRRLFGKQYASQYLDELSNLVTVPIVATDLLSIVQTDNIIANNSTAQLFFSKTILFSDRGKLVSILLSQGIDIGSPHYLFTSYSLDCGAVILPSLKYFNFHFEFFDEHSGIISFISDDFKQKILFDFYEADEFKYLEIELYKTF